MAIRLDTLEQRIIGVLIEKQYTVPDAYPLTINALLAGCNQKSNRDPQMDVEDYELEGALRALMDRDWVVRVEKDGGRAMRYDHQAGRLLGVEKAELAILSELLCRGPQAPGALKTRASRMHHFGSPGEVENHLISLSERPVPYVVKLPRRPREQQNRWRHLLDGLSADEARAGDAASDTAPPAPSPVPGATASAAPAPAPAPVASPAAANDDLLERFERLEEEVQELRDRLDRLEGR